MILPRAEQIQDLAARYYYSNNCSYYDNRSRYCRSPWNRWGRWVLAGILVLLTFIIVFFLLCLRQRRRRQARNFQTTQAPMAAPVSGNAGYYNNDPYNQSYNAPAGPPPPNYGAHENAGYYGQQTGVAQPQGAYVK